MHILNFVASKDMPYPSIQTVFSKLINHDSLHTAMSAASSTAKDMATNKVGNNLASVR